MVGCGAGRASLRQLKSCRVVATLRVLLVDFLMEKYVQVKMQWWSLFMARFCCDSGACDLSGCVAFAEYDNCNSHSLETTDPSCVGDRCLHTEGNMVNNNEGEEMGVRYVYNILCTYLVSIQA